MSADRPAILIPRGDDPLRHLAARLLTQHRDRLPDLSRIAVLFPHISAIPRFRRLLLDEASSLGHSALLPPYAGTLASWARRFPDPGKRLLSSAARELLLLELLEVFPSWRREYGDWPLAESLLALFDEMTLHDGALPGNSNDLWRQLIRGGVKLDDMSPFSDEAQFVQTVWGAWCRRLEKDSLEDPARQHTRGLARSLDQLPRDARIYLAGFVEFPAVELRWVKTLLGQRQITVLLQGGGAGAANNPLARTVESLGILPERIGEGDAYGNFLGRVYATGEDNLRARARQQAGDVPVSPACGRLVLHPAPDAESEARAIDVQVRRWLSQGLRDIGIVTNDRKLARRVRALLERANIGLQDAGGWALSTTSAATALSRWLDCVERDYPHAALLDLLKSPFLQPGISRAILDSAIPVFEQEVVRALNIMSGIEHYRYGIDHAASRWTDDPEGRRETLTRLLGRLEAAAAGLVPFLSGRVHPAQEFLVKLRESLEMTGLSRGFESDDAGHELLEMVEALDSAARRCTLRFSWTGFLQWLRRTMEQRRFHPPRPGRGVELMGLAESRLSRFEALIIAGAVREHLPGPISAPPYFNDGVRTELGLPSLARRHAALFEDFRRLLEAAPRVMVSLRREHEGERLVPSPWVEQLRTFHELAYGDSLNDPELEWLVQQAGTVIVNREAPLPFPVSPPAALLPPDLVPQAFTASDYQRLMNCPYQFFSARGLGLSAEDEVREEAEKKDYGNYLHRILQAFHAGVPGLPGPWQGTLDESARTAAGKLLHEISRQVFARDLRRHFFARGWLYRWEKCIPAYLDWEIDRAAIWRVEGTEVKKTMTCQEGGSQVILTGRLDRLDRGADGLGIIDYKTGKPPTEEDVLAGESVQLPFYGLLLEAEKVSQAAFLWLDEEDAKEKTAFSGESFAMLRAAVRERLLQIKQSLDGGACLPAWGDMETCRLCEMEGLCRRELWTEPAPGP